MSWTIAAPLDIRDGASDSYAFGTVRESGTESMTVALIRYVGGVLFMSYPTPAARISTTAIAAMRRNFPVPPGVTLICHSPDPRGCSATPVKAADMIGTIPDLRDTVLTIS